jgi:hypothetical protein
VPVLNVYLPPVVIIIRVGQPIVEVWRRLAKERKIFERHMTEPLAHVVNALQHRIESLS